MSFSINRVILVGRLGADPEEKGRSATVVKARVATTRSWRDRESGERKEETQWHQITAFGSAGEYLAKYGKKGDLVLIEGSVEYREYEGKWYTDVVVRQFDGKFEILSQQRTDGGDAASGSPRSSARGAAKGKSAPRDKTDEYDERQDAGRQRGYASSDLDDEIPF